MNKQLNEFTDLELAEALDQNNQQLNMSNMNLIAIRQEIKRRNEVKKEVKK